MADDLKRQNAVEGPFEGALVEAPPSPEAAELRVPEVKPAPEQKKEAAETAAPKAAPVKAATTSAIASPKPVQLQQIESVLEEDLKDYYGQMDEAHRKVFRIEGERTADQINSLITTAKATAKRILYLIQRWLRLIPSVNKFFLEQEAKIKTDRIMEIVEEKKQESGSKNQTN